MSSLLCRTARNVMLMCIVGIAMWGCGHEQARRIPESGTARSAELHKKPTKRLVAGEQAAVVAVQQIGVPYVYGGNSVRGFDCSGLVQYAWAKAGKRIPRTTTEQWQRLSPVDARHLQVGDLLFFRINGRIAHVGLYLGDNRFVHAPESGREVSVTSLNTDFYRRAFVRAGRPY